MPIKSKMRLSSLFEETGLLHYLSWGAIAAFIVGATYWRFQFIPSFPYFEDGVHTINVIEQFVRGDLNLLSETFVRSPLGQFFLAVPLYFTEGNTLSYRMSNLIFSVLILVLMIQFGRVSKMPLAGILAAAFLGVSALENMYVGFVRFYLIFQFFFLLASYYLYQFFVLKQKKVKWCLLLTIFLMIFVHKLSLQIFVVAFLAGVFSGRKYLVTNWKVVAGIVLLLILSMVFHLGARHGLMPRDFSPLQIVKPSKLLLTGDYFGLYNYFRDYVPFGWTLIFSSIVLYPLHRNKTIAFTSSSFVILFIPTTLLAIAASPRFICHLLPLGLFAICCFLVVWATAMASCLKRKEGVNAFVWVLLPTVICVVLALAGKENINDYNVFGRVITALDQEPPHVALQPLIDEQDNVLSVDTGISAYYLQRNNLYLLRQKFDYERQTFSPFPEDLRSSSLIDSVDALKALLEQSEGMTWVYINPKFQETVGPDLKSLIYSRTKRMVYADNGNQSGSIVIGIQ